MVDNIHKVLSFDVGIKNLAYCLLEINKEDKKFKILKWDIINLADNRKKCVFIKRDGKCCNLIASHVININDDNKYYYCTTHIAKMTKMKISNLKIITVDIYWDDIDIDIIKCELCNKRACYKSNIIEGYYCKIHYKTISKKSRYMCCSKKCIKMINQAICVLKSNDVNDDNTAVDTYWYKNGVIEPKYEIHIGWCDEHFSEGYIEFIKKKQKKYHKIVIKCL